MLVVLDTLHTLHTLDRFDGSYSLNRLDTLDGLDALEGLHPLGPGATRESLQTDGPGKGQRVENREGLGGDEKDLKRGLYRTVVIGNSGGVCWVGGREKGGGERGEKGLNGLGDARVCGGAWEGLQNGSLGGLETWRLGDLDSRRRKSPGDQPRERI